MVTVRKKNVSRFAGETLESLLFGFIYSVNWSWVPGWESKSRNVEVRHAKENEECLKEEWEQLARFSSNPEGLAQFGDLNSNMFSTYFPVLQSMKIYMKRQWTENRKGLPGGKERRLDNWIGDPGEVEEQVQSRQEQKSMIQNVGKSLHEKNGYRIPWVD